eukprot:3601987-Rhodomonas_salina.2
MTRGHVRGAVCHVRVRARGSSARASMGTAGAQRAYDEPTSAGRYDRTQYKVGGTHHADAGSRGGVWSLSSSLSRLPGTDLVMAPGTYCKNGIIQHCRANSISPRVSSEPTVRLFRRLHCKKVWFQTTLRNQMQNSQTATVLLQAVLSKTLNVLDIAAARILRERSAIQGLTSWIRRLSVSGRVCWAGWRKMLRVPERDVQEHQRVSCRGGCGTDDDDGGGGGGDGGDDDGDDDNDNGRNDGGDGGLGGPGVDVGDDAADDIDDDDATVVVKEDVVEVTGG